MGGGWDTHIWRIVTPDGTRHALRVFRTADARVSRARAEREALAMRAAAAAGLPVPPVEAIGASDGRSFLILGWVDGRPMLTVLERLEKLLGG